MQQKVFSGPGSLVNTSMVRILRKKKKKNSQKWRKVSPSFLPLLSTGNALREVHDEGLAKNPRISRCLAELGVPGTGLCVRSKSEPLTITSCLATVKEHRSTKCDTDRTRCPWTLPGETFGLCMMRLKLKKKITHRGVVMAQLVKCLLWVLDRVSVVVIKHHDKRQI